MNNPLKRRHDDRVPMSDRKKEWLYAGLFVLYAAGLVGAYLTLIDVIFGIAK